MTNRITSKQNGQLTGILLRCVRLVPYYVGLIRLLFNKKTRFIRVINIIYVEMITFIFKILSKLKGTRKSLECASPTIFLLFSVYKFLKQLNQLFENWQVLSSKIFSCISFPISISLSSLCILPYSSVHEFYSLLIH